MHVQCTPLALPVQCEQMEVELHDVAPSARPGLKGRLDNYRKELSRIRKDFVSSFTRKCSVCG